MSFRCVQLRVPASRSLTARVIIAQSAPPSGRRRSARPAGTRRTAARAAPRRHARSVSRRSSAATRACTSYSCSAPSRSPASKWLSLKYSKTSYPSPWAVTSRIRRRRIDLGRGRARRGSTASSTSMAGAGGVPVTTGSRPATLRSAVAPGAHPAQMPTIGDCSPPAGTSSRRRQLDHPRVAGDQPDGRQLVEHRRRQRRRVKPSQPGEPGPEPADRARAESGAGHRRGKSASMRGDPRRGRPA